MQANCLEIFCHNSQNIIYKKQNLVNFTKSFSS